MDDNEFLRQLNDFLDPPADTNPDMEGVQIEWLRNDPRFGSLHIFLEHGISEAEVEQVLLEVPPHVEARRHPSHPGRTLFWGATRSDKSIIVVCED